MCQIRDLATSAACTAAVAATTAAISELETQLMAESDLGIRAQLLNEIDEKTQDLAMQNSLLANEQAKLTTAENKLADAQAKLTEA